MPDNTTSIVADLTNQAFVIYRNERTGELVAKHARDFPPRRSYPIAVVAIDGSIVRLTIDPLPDETLLSTWLRELREHFQATLDANNPLAAVMHRAMQRAADLGCATWKTPFPATQPAATPTPQPAPIPTLSLYELSATYVANAGRTLVAIDVSGSCGAASEPMEAHFAALPNTTVVTFDHEINAGGGWYGGGGTDFGCVQRYAETAEAPFDRVVVITDGYAPHITPADPASWVWAITEQGDTWPARVKNAMTTVRLG